MAAELESQYYLSAKRFHVTSFGTGTAALGGYAANSMRKVVDTENRSSHPLPPEAVVSSKSIMKEKY